MIHTLMIASSNKKINNYEHKNSFWLNFGRFIKNHFSNHSSDDYTDTESSSDTMFDLDDIFDEFEGDFDEMTIYENGYDGDSEDND